jgi:hypothetical protein
MLIAHTNCTCAGQREGERCGDICLSQGIARGLVSVNIWNCRVKRKLVFLVCRAVHCLDVVVVADPSTGHTALTIVFWVVQANTPGCTKQVSPLFNLVAVCPYPGSSS